MDPDATLTIIRDRHEYIADRLAALNNLCGWLQMDGFVPAGIDTTTIISIDTAISVLIERLGPTHDLVLVTTTHLLNTI